MITIEKQKWLANDNYKNYLIKCSVTNSATRFHTRHGKEPWQKYAVLILGFEAMEVDRKKFALMLSRIRNDNRAEARRRA